jgi:hypothetical protein
MEERRLELSLQMDKERMESEMELSLLDSQQLFVSERNLGANDRSD